VEGGGCLGAHHAADGGQQLAGAVDWQGSLRHGHHTQATAALDSLGMVVRGGRGDAGEGRVGFRLRLTAVKGMIMVVLVADPHQNQTAH